MKTYIRYSTDDCDSTALTIEGLFVAPEERGKGRGRELVEEVIKYAEDNAYKTVNLYAYADDVSDACNGLAQEALVAFYESCGFDLDPDSDGLMEYTV